jgi:hypothetical protein
MASLIVDSKTALQLVHVGLAQQLIEGLEQHGAASAGVVHGVCQCVYLLSQSRTVRQILLAKFDGLRNKISAAFAKHAATNRAVARWGKDAMNKLALPP